MWVGMCVVCVECGAQWVVSVVQVLVAVVLCAGVRSDCACCLVCMDANDMC